MAHLETYRRKFADTGWVIFEYAIRESQKDNLNNVLIEHIVIALAKEKFDLFEAIMRKLGVNSVAVVNLLEERKARGPQYRGEGVRISPDVISLFGRALDIARASYRHQIEANDLLVALSQDKLSPLNQALSFFNINQNTVIEAVHEYVRMYEPPPPLSREPTARIKSGPYTGFAGKIKEFNEDRSTVKIIVSVLGRATLLELNIDEVQVITFINR